MMMMALRRQSQLTMTEVLVYLISGNLLLFTVSGDEYNACGRQPRTRQITDIPCNFSEVAFCSKPGNDYPWQPLLKFLNDNRGLMKRMYGDTRQSVLLRHEIEVHNIRITTAAARSLELDESTFSFEDDANGTVNTFTPRAREGVNACPSQVEVVSPYWANNTRGEAVAVLNVYPFEQFVYFEKCTNENHQMFCRDGCRCEQQYGLQRLLAFDPRNECRGIFSEWFRFPSCCLCRCYGVPYDDESINDDPSTAHRLNGVRDSMTPTSPPLEEPTVENNVTASMQSKESKRKT